jgi:hypothetical protein
MATFGVIKRGSLTPWTRGRSIGWPADRRRDPTPIYMGRPARPLHDPGNHHAPERWWRRQPAPTRRMTDPARAPDRRGPPSATPLHGTRSDEFRYTQPFLLGVSSKKRTSASAVPGCRISSGSPDNAEIAMKRKVDIPRAKCRFREDRRRWLPPRGHHPRVPCEFLATKSGHRRKPHPLLPANRFQQPCPKGMKARRM